MPSVASDSALSFWTDADVEEEVTRLDLCPISAPPGPMAWAIDSVGADAGELASMEGCGDAVVVGVGAAVNSVADGVGSDDVDVDCGGRGVGLGSTAMAAPA
ncbi:hypothetical protein FBY36_0266 [Arthrobacter sp. SLBN-122]|nr:hypothetical protein FBY36_0266 [Arthrobacter sp. SLBN-122]